MIIQNRTYRTYFLIIILSVSSLLFGHLLLNESKAVNWLNPQKEFIAGSAIKLNFNIEARENCFLYVHYTQGKTVLMAEKSASGIIFNIPDYIYQKAGLLSFKLIHNQKVAYESTLNILPKDEDKNSLEAYLGPPSTWVGPENYVTFVTIPLDEYDNALLDGTPIQIKENINKNLSSNTIISKDLISWKRIFAPTKSGKVFIASEYKNKITKEFEAEIYPTVAQTFSVSYERLHDFADGNQLTTLQTSVIKDKYGNVVSNGTKVNFELVDENNNLLKVFGSTKDGVAKAQWLHPESAKKYIVSANISDLAYSNEIILSYKSWPFELNFELTNSNRTLQIGPLKSYMNQYMPNGTKVFLKIYQNGKKIGEMLENSQTGFVNLELEKHKYPPGQYLLEIETMGKTQTIENIKLN